MRALVLTVAIALLGAALGDDIPTEDNVLVLTKPIFDDVISSNDYVLVEFCEYPTLVSCYFSNSLTISLF